MVVINNSNMNSLKIAVIALFFGFAGFIGERITAEESAPNQHQTLEERTAEPSKGINSGWVVAYGALLTKPYRVEFRDDTIRINDLPFNPRKMESDSTLFVKSPKHEILHALEKTYVDEYSLHGFEAAKQKVQNRFGTDSLISKIKFDTLGNAALVWSDGQTEDIYLYASIARRMGRWPQPEELRLRNMENLIHALNMEQMIAFGGKYTIVLNQERTQETIEQIRDINRKRASIFGGRGMLTVIVGKDFAEDVVKNLDSWRF
jgi:hypothetical protein